MPVNMEASGTLCVAFGLLESYADMQVPGWDDGAVSERGVLCIATQIHTYSQHVSGLVSLGIVLDVGEGQRS